MFKIFIYENNRKKLTCGNRVHIQLVKPICGCFPVPLTSKNICPSVIDITFVGIYAETSPACVSITGNAVRDPEPFASFIFAARSNKRLCKKKTSPGYASRPGGRRNNNDICRYATACFDKSS